MTHKEFAKFRRILEATVVEIKHSGWKKEQIAIQTSAEPTEQRVGMAERDFAVRTLETQSVKLRQTRAALARIADRTYGVCQECGESISARRLAAMPSAALCIRCQEAEDCGHGAHAGRYTFPAAA